MVKTQTLEPGCLGLYPDPVTLLPESMTTSAVQ